MKKFFCSIGKGITRHKGRSIFILVLLVVAVVAIIVITNRMNSQKPTMTKVRQNSISLSKMDLTSSVSATGTIESADTATVSAAVNNVEITEVKVSEGDAVKAGDTLVVFDEEDLQESYQDAVENLADVKSQNATELSTAKKKLEDAKETYETGKTRGASSVATAKTEYKEAKETVSTLKKQINSESNQEAKAKLQEELTKAEQEEKQAKTSYENAVAERDNTNKQNKSNVDSAKTAITTTENNNKKSLKEAQRSVDDAKKSLEACSVTAPIDGTVTAVGVSKGDTYSGGDMFEISDCVNLQVSTSVDEYDINKVKEGQKVVILTDATEEDEIEGEITFVAPAAGSSSLSSSGSGTSSQSMAGAGTSGSTSTSSGYSVIMKIKTVDERLKIGMTAKCSIILEEAADVFAVPYDAIHTNSNNDNVIYVVDTSGQREVAVTKGMESDYYVEISGDELQEGMQVMIPSDATSESSGTDSSQTGKSMIPGMDAGMSGGRGNKPYGGGMSGKPSSGMTGAPGGN